MVSATRGQSKLCIEQPANIRNAVSRFFTRFGPLRTVMQGAHELSHDVVMVDVVDVYQTTNRRGSFLDPALVAPGSVRPPGGADVRTTLVLHRQDGGWKIIAARVADLLAENATAALPIAEVTYHDVMHFKVRLSPGD
jgi:hypothetical protein